jgi:hypothetical protein
MPTLPVSTPNPVEAKFNDLDKELELKNRSAVVELEAVEDFKFIFADKVRTKDQSQNEVVERKLADVEGILIHANWADYDLSAPSESEEGKTEGNDCENDRLSPKKLKKMSLNIPDTVMKDGLLFIWVEKEFTYDVIVFFET